MGKTINDRSAEATWKQEATIGRDLLDELLGDTTLNKGECGDIIEALRSPARTKSATTIVLEYIGKA